MSYKHTGEPYRAKRSITRQQKVKLLEAVKNQTINLQSLKPFAGMEFYLCGDHFICKENSQRYSYAEILKIYNDLPDIPDTPKLIEFKAMEKGKLIVNMITILPISESEILETIVFNNK